MIARAAATLATLACLALPLPAAAQDPEPPQDGIAEGLGLLNEGARLLWRGLVDEAEPAMRDMVEGVGPTLDELSRDMAPLLEAMTARIGSLSAYHAPEFLPNGDILIRRRTPLEPPAEAPEGAEAPPAPGAETEL